MGDLRIKTLRCEYLINPLGIDVRKPRLSWIVESDERGQKQTAYRIIVATNEDLVNEEKGDLWNSGKVTSDETVHIIYKGSPLTSQMVCYWKVKVWDSNDISSEWSEISKWTMGLLEPSDWKAKWIGAPPKKVLGIKKYLPRRKYDPSPLIRKSFILEGVIKEAYVHTTALGEYELFINGKRVSDHILAPEWTDYNKRVQYQTYNVCEYLQKGKNVISATLGDGWYRGNLGPFGLLHYHYGVNRRFIFQLIVKKDDGTSLEVISDASWKIFENGPIQKSDHFKGEIYNVKKEKKGWDKPEFDDSEWSYVQVDNTIKPNLVAQMNEPIRIVKEINPIAVTEPKQGVFIFDMGQNIAGWCKIRLGGEICAPNAIVTLRHGEMLNDDGTLFNSNLGLAKARDIFILNGIEEREFHPHFTYHGFQYVEVTGLKPEVKPTLDIIKGCAIASDCAITGAFESSDSTLNKLWSNIIWTQRDNMISVPTDCPQRSERMGWMGDAQVFGQTSIYNMDMAAFYTKWIRDIRDAQDKYGRYPDFVPYPRNILYDRILKFYCTAGWADCGIILPWDIYLNYNDKKIIKDHYESAKKFIDLIHLTNPDLIWKKSIGNKYGDWLNGDTIKLDNYPKKGAEIPFDVYATAFFARSTKILSMMADVLGKTEDSQLYSDLAEKIKSKFNESYVNEDGEILGDTQAGYAIALDFDLLPKEIQPKAIKKMLDAIEKYDNRISTGFVSTIALMKELTRWGYVDIAYQLLFSRRVPSWYFMIDQGATTMWERWDGYVKGRGFHSTMMNSFNHYSIGSVGEWMYRVILGINLDEKNPGYKHIIIKPIPNRNLSRSKGHYESIRGKIIVNWNIERDNFTLELTIPANTHATIHLPAKNEKDIVEGGTKIHNLEGITLKRYDKNIAIIEIPSGEYKFESNISSDFLK
jgi:alpha-L-rhamnosidase